MFEDLPTQPEDVLLSIIDLFQRDIRARKLDLGVGTYRNELGHTPVMSVVKAAEQILIRRQHTKAYLGPQGDDRFAELLRPVVFGDADAFEGRLASVQTPGGGGALRLGAELVLQARPDARVWLGLPTWPNHPAIFRAVGLETIDYDYFDIRRQRLCFDEMLIMLGQARRGDVVLVQGCCHNPSGSDLEPAQWDQLAAVLADRGLIPFVDLAYQGLGHSLESDAYGTRAVLQHAEEALVAYSCDKNFGLYRDRTGALYVLSRDRASAKLVRENMIALARVNWSMPPDHGAAVVRVILESPHLTLAWRQELGGMCQRIRQVREVLAAAEPHLAFLTGQNGMFSQLSLHQTACAELRHEHGVYMANSGRINLAGLRASDVPMFVHALSAVGVINAGLMSSRV